MSESWDDRLEDHDAEQLDAFDDQDQALLKQRGEIKTGGKQKYHDRNDERGKLFVRDRLARLFDDGIVCEDGLWANVQAGDLPADGVVTGVGDIHGRKTAVMANDSTVKAGSWGWRTVEKIIRIQETAERLEIPLIYLVDSAGARITDQLEMFPGRRGAGKIFNNQVRLSGFVPQICLLFGPSAAGGAYIPAFCDVVTMVDGNASMYLGSPRMAEMVIGEEVTLEEMGGAKMHTSESGCGDVLVDTEEEALDWCRDYLQYMPQNCQTELPEFEPSEPDAPIDELDDIIPKNQNRAFDIKKVIRHIADDSSFLEIKEDFASELVCAFARIDGRPVGIVGSQPMKRGGVLFTDSADKGARFINLCDAFGIPLVFLADVPGFMIGTRVEKEGIIRHGAKMITAVARATVPKLSVIVRKAYGAGLYAMCGPGFEPDATLALPEAMIAVMGPEAAVNAVYARKIDKLDPEDRPEYVQKKRKEYEEDIDIYRLASELIVDEMISKRDLRKELVNRLEIYRSKSKESDWPDKKHGVTPV
jgi:acetyl-CoA carboxylase carboxyltransferase component